MRVSQTLREWPEPSLLSTQAMYGHSVTGYSVHVLKIRPIVIYLQFLLYKEQKQTLVMDGWHVLYILKHYCKGRYYRSLSTNCMGPDSQTDPLIATSYIGIEQHYHNVWIACTPCRTLYTIKMACPKSSTKICCTHIMDATQFVWDHANQGCD